MPYTFSLSSGWYSMHTNRMKYDIHILYVLGFLLPAQSGSIYNPFKGKDKNWSPRKQIIISLIMLLIAVSVCFILYGKLW